MSVDCVERFREFLRMVWVDNTPEEALQQWRHRVADFPDAARQDLECLDAVVADPPEDIVRMLNDDGWVILTHQPDPETATDYTREEYVEWLREMTARFRAAAERET